MTISMMEFAEIGQYRYGEGNISRPKNVVEDRLSLHICTCAFITWTLRLHNNMKQTSNIALNGMPMSSTSS